MSALERIERDERIMRIVIRQSRYGDPVPTSVIAEIARAGGRGLTYSQTGHVLRRLVRNGHLRKPTPGYYLLAEEES